MLYDSLYTSYIPDEYWFHRIIHNASSAKIMYIIKPNDTVLVVNNNRKQTLTADVYATW